MGENDQNWKKCIFRLKDKYSVNLHDLICILHPLKLHKNITKTKKEIWFEQIIFLGNLWIQYHRI